MRGAELAGRAAHARRRRASSAPAPAAASSRRSSPRAACRSSCSRRASCLRPQRLHRPPARRRAAPATATARRSRRSATSPIALPLGRAVGGTTILNSATCYRTPPRAARRAGACGRADELDPYFRRVERIFNVCRVPREVAGRNAHAHGARRRARSAGRASTCTAPRAAASARASARSAARRGGKQHTGNTYVPLAWDAGAITVTGARATRGRCPGARRRSRARPAAGGCASTPTSSSSPAGRSTRRCCCSRSGIRHPALGAQPLAAPRDRRVGRARRGRRHARRRPAGLRGRRVRRRGDHARGLGGPAGHARAARCRRPATSTAASCSATGASRRPGLMIRDRSRGTRPRGRRPRRSSATTSSARDTALLVRGDRAAPPSSSSPPARARVHVPIRGAAPVTTRRRGARAAPRRAAAARRSPRSTRSAPPRPARVVDADLRARRRRPARRRRLGRPVRARRQPAADDHGARHPRGVRARSARAAPDDEPESAEPSAARRPWQHEQEVRDVVPDRSTLAVRDRPPLRRRARPSALQGAHRRRARRRRRWPVFWGTSISLYLDRRWTAPIWRACRARSGRDWMLNSGVFRFRLQAAPARTTHAVSALLFATYPLWLVARPPARPQARRVRRRRAFPTLSPDARALRELLRQGAPPERAARVLAAPHRPPAPGRAATASLWLTLFDARRQPVARRQADGRRADRPPDGRLHRDRRRASSRPGRARGALRAATLDADVGLHVRRPTTPSSATCPPTGCTTAAVPRTKSVTPHPGVTFAGRVGRLRRRRLARRGQPQLGLRARRALDLAALRRSSTAAARQWLELVARPHQARAARRRRGSPTARCSSTASATASAARSARARRRSTSTPTGARFVVTGDGVRVEGEIERAARALRRAGATPTPTGPSTTARTRSIADLRLEVRRDGGRERRARRAAGARRTSSACARPTTACPSSPTTTAASEARAPLLWLVAVRRRTRRRSASTRRRRRELRAGRGARAADRRVDRLRRRRRPARRVPRRGSTSEWTDERRCAPVGRA